MRNVTLTLRCSKSIHWIEAFFELLFAIVGGFVPIYLGAFFVRINGAWTNWEAFFNKGELAIYSATFFASAIFVKVRTKIEIINNEEKDDNRIKVSMYSIIIPIIGLLFSGAIFASVFFRDFMKVGGYDYGFYYFCSISLFIISFASSFMFSVFDIIRSNVDPDDLRNITEDDLERKMKKARTK